MNITLGINTIHITGHILNGSSIYHISDNNKYYLLTYLPIQLEHDCVVGSTERRISLEWTMIV